MFVSAFFHWPSPATASMSSPEVTSAEPAPEAPITGSFVYVNGVEPSSSPGKSQMPVTDPPTV